MCIAVFLWNSHPLYPFLLLLNRDEYHNRETTPLGWWEDGLILGGRDGEAGGTWLACSRDGKFAFVTNVREIPSRSHVKSRGDLPVRFLKSKKSPKEFAEEVVEEVEQLNGFNLIVGDVCSMSMVYITNRPKDGDDRQCVIEEVSPGIHVLSNAKLDTPWPKAKKLRNGFEDVVGKYGEAEISLKEMTEILMKDTRKDYEGLSGIYSLEVEYLLSSIFVEATDTPSGRYGTRSTSAVVVRRNRSVSFYETYLLENNVWKDETVNYEIQTEKCVP